MAHRDADDPIRIAAPCPFVSCPHHLHVDVTRGLAGGSITFMDGDITRTCVLDIVDANPDGVSREEIADILAVSEERTRVMERKYERDLRRDFDREDFEDGDPANLSPLGMAGDL